MIDITPKTSTLRMATARAVVVAGRAETLGAIQNQTVPKGDVFAVSRAIGLLAVKKTADLLPSCHPIPIEYTDIEYEIDGLEIRILCTVKAICKTGVEVEAVHGASVVALNMYDMLKPIDKGIEIQRIKLVEKRGGKSDFRDQPKDISAVVVVCSDLISAGKKEDKTGQIIVEKLRQSQVTLADYVVIPDDEALIQAQAEQYQGRGVDLIIYTGGTGLSERDVTPEALKPLLHRRIPGIAEAIRSYGQNRTPYAMLSRSVAGVIGRTLVLALPGSTGGARDSMEAIFPAVLHIFKILKGFRHD